jgi:hypothetical protein
MRLYARVIDNDCKNGHSTVQLQKRARKLYRYDADWWFRTRPAVHNRNEEASVLQQRHSPMTRISCCKVSMPLNGQIGNHSHSANSLVFKESSVARSST